MPITSTAFTRVVTVGLVLAAGISAAQQGGLPARDNVVADRGTPSISGRITALEDGRPLRRAQIRLTLEGSREARIAMTNEEGRYRLDDLPAGRYTITATKTSYVDLSYGQRRPFESPRPLALAEGQQAESVDIALPRAGVIVVRITDPTGEPVSGVDVWPMRLTYTDRGRGLVRAPSGGLFQQTDDRGVIRIFGLMPGEYFLMTRNPIGPGRTLGTSERGFALAQTFYPGTANEAEAQRVSVGVGQEVQITFPLVMARLARISGVIRSADGGPLTRPALALTERTLTGGVSGRGVQVQPDGQFTIADVLPGRYTIEALAGPGALDARPFFSLPVTIAGGEDISGLVITPRVPIGALRGRVVFDGGAPPSTVQPRSFQLTAWAASSGTNSGPTSPADDWTFEITGLDDVRTLRLLAAPSPWLLKAVIHNGVDVTDSPIDFTSGPPLDNLQVVVTDRQTEIRGTVTDTQGRPVNDYAVLVFADDPSRWVLLRSRHVAAGRPDQNGRFTVTGLPPGRYRAVALEYLERGAERDPDLLAGLRERAMLVTIAEGESRALALPLTSY